MLDTGSWLNLISQKFVVQWDLQPCAADLPLPEALNGSGMYVYGAYQFEFTLVDSWGHGKKCNTLFYAIDQKGPDIVIGMPGLKKMKVLIDPEAE